MTVACDAVHIDRFKLCGCVPVALNFSLPSLRWDLWLMITFMIDIVRLILPKCTSVMTNCWEAVGGSSTSLESCFPW